METATTNQDPSLRPNISKTSLRRLVQLLTSDVKAFFRQEVGLAKVELSEKVTWVGRNAAWVAVGGLMAYAGIIVFLIGVGWLVAWALRQAGLQAGLAGFLGLAIIGLLFVLAGTAFVLSSLKAFSSGSFAPQRTLHTLQRLKGPEHVSAPAASSEAAARPSSEQMQAQVEQTENHLGETLDELGRRLSPHEINARMKQRISHKPYRSGLVAMGVGVLSGLFLARESRRP